MRLGTLCQLQLLRLLISADYSSPVMLPTNGRPKESCSMSGWHKTPGSSCFGYLTSIRKRPWATAMLQPLYFSPRHQSHDVVACNSPVVVRPSAWSATAYPLLSHTVSWLSMQSQCSHANRHQDCCHCIHQSIIWQHMGACIHAAQRMYCQKQHAGSIKSWCTSCHEAGSMQIAWQHDVQL